MDSAKLLSELAQLIADSAGFMSATVKTAMYDGDHKSGELVIAIDSKDAGHQEFVISSSDVKLLEDDDVQTTALFTYPDYDTPDPMFPDYPAHSGQRVRILAPLGNGLTKVRADDGWEGVARDDELSDFKDV